ncbi:MAG: RNA-binding transcriptional accessory protein, partial [Clostridia bacterium]|nr:RNA-binding transcriptional accessory protein [Clostridia bacterium]
MDAIALRLKKEFELKDFQVTNTIELIDAGNTIPFIARYRKEKTGELDDQLLRRFFDRLTYLRNLEERKAEVIRLIDEQEKLTDELRVQIEKAETLQEIEDIYRPYRPKRRTRATVAKEKGLEPLAEIIFAQTITDGNFLEQVESFVDAEKGVESVDDALAGAMDIIAENISDNAEFRKQIRAKTMQKGLITSKAATEEDSVYRLYYDFSEALLKVANHRLLAMNRGEKEELLKVSVSMDEELIHAYLSTELLKKPASVTTEYVELAAKD